MIAVQIPASSFGLGIGRKAQSFSFYHYPFRFYTISSLVESSAMIRNASDHNSEAIERSITLSCAEFAGVPNAHPN